MKLGNIIYEKELVNHTRVDYINYYDKPTEYHTLDKTLPTLYVGWSFMKLCNPNYDIIQNADILHKKIITNELYWECSFEESKSSHVKGIESFINLVPQFYFIPKYTFINLDPVFFQIVDIQGLMDVVPKEINALYNMRNEMIYILCENKITGINLKMYDFFKMDTQEIIKSLRQRTSKCFYDPDATIYQSYYKILPNFTLLKRYLITILSK
jgi:hypothetical protein